MPAARRKRSLIVATLVVTAAAGLLYLVIDQGSALVAGNRGVLADYRLVAGPIKVSEQARQLSGACFDDERNRLFIIDSRPPAIFELEVDGTVLRRIDLAGFNDTEGITCLGDNRFAVVSERRDTLSWFTIEADTRAVEYQAVPSVSLSDLPVGNHGPEGIAYAAERNALYIVKEDTPERIMSYAWSPVNRVPQRLSDPWDPERLAWLKPWNLSGIHYHADSGHLLVLSRKSKVIIEYDLNGEEVGRFNLTFGSAGLAHSIGKAEGLAMARGGTLYVVSEPDLLFVFSDRGQNVPTKND